MIIQPSAAPVTRLRPTPDSTGFWLLREDGKLVLYNAPYHGEPAAITGKAIDLIPTANADGYWILTQTGGLLPFGAAADLGGLAGLTDTPVAAGFSGSPTGDGLWIVEESGGLTSMGTAGAIASGVTGYGFNPTPPPQFVLHVSSNPDRSDSVPLDGASIQGDVYIFVSPIGESSRGRFAFNQSPLETETPFVDDSWPLDLEGGSLLTANPFNTYSLAPGAHTLNGHIERLHGLESASVSATFTIANPVCGDGIIEGPEECDAGACCDPVFCQLIEDGTLCREAEGTCDLPEFCSGGSPFCPTDSYKPAGWVCRAAGTSCDVEEACTGASAQCPPNGVLPDGTPCEGSGECVLGYCEEPELPEEDVSEPEPEADAGRRAARRRSRGRDSDGNRRSDIGWRDRDGRTGCLFIRGGCGSGSRTRWVGGDGNPPVRLRGTRVSTLGDAPPVSNDVANGNRTLLQRDFRGRQRKNPRDGPSGFCRNRGKRNPSQPPPQADALTPHRKRVGSAFSSVFSSFLATERTSCIDTGFGPQYRDRSGVNAPHRTRERGRTWSIWNPHSSCLGLSGSCSSESFPGFVGRAPPKPARKGDFKITPYPTPVGCGPTGWLR